MGPFQGIACLIYRMFKARGLPGRLIVTLQTIGVEVKQDMIRGGSGLAGGLKIRQVAAFTNYGQIIACCVAGFAGDGHMSTL